MKCSICGREFGNGTSCQNCGVDRVKGLANYGGYGYSSGSSSSNNEGYASSNMMVCYSCGEIIPKNSKFCPHCRTNLWIECPKCGHKYSSQYKNCNNCGANYWQSLKEREEREKKEETERKRREEAEQKRREEEAIKEAKELYPLLVIGCVSFTLGLGGIIGWILEPALRDYTLVLPISICAALIPSPLLLCKKDEAGDILGTIWGILFAIFLVIIVGILLSYVWRH